MAAGFLSKPGCKYGPCISPCLHRDCQETRRMAESICRFCQKPIGYERGFYVEKDNIIVHGSCAEDNVKNLIDK